MANIEYAKVVPNLQAIRSNARHGASKANGHRNFNKAIAILSDEAFPLNAKRLLRFLDLKSHRYKDTQAEVNEIFIKFPRFRHVEPIVVKYVEKDRRKNKLAV